MVDYVYDDMNRLANSVKTRTEIAKMEVMATGNMTINENGLSMTIPYGVNKLNDLSGWEDTAHDILGDIEEMVEALAIHDRELKLSAGFDEE